MDILGFIPAEIVDRGMWGAVGAGALALGRVVVARIKSKPDVLTAAAETLQAANSMAATTFAQLRQEIAGKAEEIDRLRESIGHLSDAVDVLEAQAEAKDAYILDLQALLHDAGIDYPDAPPQATLK